MIQKAVLSDLETIHQITKACARAMIGLGIYQWNEHYPTRSRLEEDIQFEELYTIKKAGKIKGIVVISPHMDEEYFSIEWLTPSRKNLYIHRLAVHPEDWGNGYAQKLMTFAERFAKENKYNSIRLDTFSQNKRNQKFYETRGYQRLGDIYFPKQSEHPFYCYELVL